jgi:predicted nucleic acid-binding protein
VIILDTNVVSEPLRPAPDERVVRWLDAQPAEALYLTSINTAELWAGVARLPRGARRHTLETSLDAMLRRLFGARRLAFDDAAARVYADLVEHCDARGTALPLADGMIAAIARVHGFAVATRDTAPFVAAGITTVDPWANGARSRPG